MKLVKMYPCFALRKCFYTLSPHLDNCKAVTNTFHVHRLREGDDNSRIFCLFIGSCALLVFLGWSRKKLTRTAGAHCKCSWAGVRRSSHVLSVRTVSALGLE